MTHDTAVALLARMNAGETTSEEIVGSLLDRAQSCRAAQRLRPSRCRARSSPRPGRSTAKRRAGEPLGPLAGVPVAIKDVLCVEGEPTTCGSRMLAELPPAVRRHGDRPAQGGRRGPVRQDEHGRVRDGLVDREQRLRADPEPLGRVARARRLVGRLGRGRRGRTGSAGARAPTPAARSASRRPSAASSASSRPTAGSAATA